MKVLNVGGGSTQMPEKYAGWDVDLLDINPEVGPDICMDARHLDQLQAGQYDAVFCSHALEHFHAHEIKALLNGFKHVLKTGGFVEIHVPDIQAVSKQLAEHEPDAIAYTVDAGPITYHDILYGWNQALEAGNEFYAHKCGFSANSLGKAIFQAGFDRVEVWQGSCFDLLAYGVKP